MRTITTSLYLYDELPTEEAKEKARSWWGDCEAEDPAWLSEHDQSMFAAVAKCDEISPKDRHDPMLIASLVKQSEACSFTGYCADCFLADILRQEGLIPSPAYVRNYYHEEWRKEIEDRLTNVEVIEDNIRFNECEFYENGERV